MRLRLPLAAPAGLLAARLSDGAAPNPVVPWAAPPPFPHRDFVFHPLRADTACN